MIDRRKVVAVLQNRFPNAARQDVAAAANEIVGLDEGWEEFEVPEEELGYHFAIQCSDICWLARDLQDGREFLILRRRPRAS